jgi:hypothetical protein
VGLSLVSVSRLVELVTNSVLGGRESAGSDGISLPDTVFNVGGGRRLPSAGTNIGVTGDALVDLLAGAGSGPLDGLAHVVEGMLGGVHDGNVGVSISLGVS